MTRTGDDPQPVADSGDAVSFHGAHQAGIATAVQDRLHFASFDVKTDDRDEFVQLLKDWTKAASRMTEGHAVGEGAYGGLPEAPPDDTGEALGLKPSRLTLTIGFGPSLFEKFGLADRRPEALVDLPKFPGDNLDKARSDGDLCIQACADDPQVAVHAIRNLARIGFGKVAVRWSQLGFGKTSSTTPDAQTPRNLMGFKDGTRNIMRHREGPSGRARVGRRQGHGRQLVLDDRGFVPRRATHPDEHRDVGPYVAPGSRRTSSAATRARAPRSARPRSATSRS